MFTPRELEVLRLVCEGYSNTEIAQKLCISSHTAKAHVVSILRKLGVRNRIRAAFLVAKLGILDKK